MQSTKGSIRLFHLAGIDVFLHWSWFFVAALEISMRGRRYPSIAWNIAEYLTLFLIVTLHEFGHALACCQVGGTANRIMLWPLGGVAYVDPPPRTAATLWSIAARQRRTPWSVCCAGILGTACRMETGCPSCLQTTVGCVLHQPRFARLQSVANLSPRRRADSPISSLVCSRTRPQSEGGCGARIARRSWTDCCRRLAPFFLDRTHLFVHGDELLDGLTAGANIVAVGVTCSTRQAGGGIHRDNRPKHSVTSSRSTQFEDCAPASSWLPALRLSA